MRRRTDTVLAKPTTPLRRASVALLALASAGAALWLASGAVRAQTAQVVPAPGPVVVAQAGAGGPAWTELSPAQQNALRPLAGDWNNLPAAQKRKWLRASEKLDSAQPQVQAKAQERMGEWSQLTPQQRAQARLNFAETRALTDGLTPEQRQTQWQAYQLLSPEEKRQLAASARGLPPGAAVAVRPAQTPIRAEPAPEFGSGAALSRLQGQAPARRIAPLPLKPGQPTQQP